MQRIVDLLFLYSQLYEISESLLYETQNIIVKILVLILNLNLMHETHHCPRWLLQISMSDLGDFSPKILFFGGHISLYRTILLIQHEIWQYTTKTLFIKNYRNLTVNRISLSSDLLINNWLSGIGIRENTDIFLLLRDVIRRRFALSLDKIASPASITTRQKQQKTRFFALAAHSGGCTRKYQHEQALLIISLRFALSLEKIGYTRKYQHEQALLIISLVCTIVG